MTPVVGFRLDPAQIARIDALGAGAPGARSETLRRVVAAGLEALERARAPAKIEDLDRRRLSGLTTVEAVEPR